MQETEISDELIQETIKYEENTKEGESNPNSRKGLFFILFVLTIETIRWILVVFYYTFVCFILNAIKIAILTGCYIFLTAEFLDIREYTIKILTALFINQ
jgi:hypothetical protein